MRALSAAEAISPAINRTREFLFAPPFRWLTFLKLCLVAAITEGLGTNLQSNANKNHSSGDVGPMIYHFSPMMIAAIIAVALLLFVVVLLIFYVMTRLRFAYFHCLTTNTRLIKPGWNLYRPQANRFFRMNVGVGICFALMAALMVSPFIPGFIRLFHNIQEGRGPDVSLVLSLALPLIPIFMLIVVAAIALDIILRDGMLPHYALEDATAGQAWSALWERVLAEKGAFFAYGILRIVLPVIAFIGIVIVLLVPGLVLVGCVAGAEYAIHSAFAEAAGAQAAIGAVLEIFIGVIALAFALVIGISIGGPVSTAIREYALVFYGSRYQKLGELLFPASQLVQAGIPGAPAD
ncbi:DUF7544 domain-containing protein [Occallatibacter savannae]|uniref:DUF7544 domain-containing protein n=1 Tax=Occallatibacter savannae TaxID=1002691 RepID=UPI000D68618C|nr:hypothetical protein [Occallatibacter savannae]